VAMTSRGSGVLGDMLAELRPNLISVVVVNLMLGFMVQGIDNAAHIGGLAGGLALGWLVGRHSLETIPSPRVTLIPIVLTAGLATAAVVSLGWRQDILTELGRVAEHINKAEDAFRSSWADVEAGRQQAADVAADVERTVFPFIRDAQGRADEILRVATARAADAPRDSDARVAHGEAPAGVRTALTLASAWKVCLAEYAAAWQLRVAGLREHDARRVAEGDERAEAAIREMSRALAGR